MKCIPAIRFEGFEDDWKQCKLGELLEFHNGFNGSSERYGRGIPLISVMDILSNDFITSENVRTKADLTETEFQRFKVGYGDVLFQRSSENVEDAGTSNVYLDECKCAVFGGFVICGKKKSEYVPLFLKYGLTNKDVRAQIMSKAQGAQHINISQDTLQGTEILLPSQYEQEKIGNYFRNFDTLITLYRHKCERLKSLKQAMLQKMFPREGALVPEIRFEGFTEPWEQRKLSEMCGTFEYGLNAAAKKFDGKNKYIRITDIDDTSREFLLSDLSSPDICLDGMSKYLLSRGDIVFARTGASVGKTYIYRENDGIVYFAGFLIRTKVNQDNEAEFVFQSTLLPSYEKYIRITSQRSGQPGVNAQEYGEYDLFAPSKEEQKIIGQFLRGIDNLITLHQRKYEKLLDCKKAFLAKMFGGEC